MKWIKKLWDMYVDWLFDGFYNEHEKKRKK